MARGPEIAAHFAQALARSRCVARPYRHWQLDGAFPPGTCEAIAELPFAPAAGDTLGRRETHNSTRVFFNPVNRARFSICEAVAKALQDRLAVDAIERTCGVVLSGTGLRIEYCLDTDGFWLEPHTDIAAKKFTMLVYLSANPGSEGWGTDIMDADHRIVSTVPYRRNGGLVFVPASDTWHGFRRRPIVGVRKSLIVNYVAADWKSRHELAFPDEPVTHAPA